MEDSRSRHRKSAGGHASKEDQRKLFSQYKTFWRPSLNEGRSGGLLQKGFPIGLRLYKQFRNVFTL